MTDVLQELIELLSLERVDENVFHGQSQDLGWGQVFGGQVLGQALAAATQTTPADRNVHSLHAYFLRPGDVDHPIIYEVDRIRDGQSFTTRRVIAVQNGKPIFNLSASFQRCEAGFEHADPMPDVPGPEGLHSESEIWQKYAERIPEPIRSRALAERPIELRPLDPVDIFQPQSKGTDHAVWIRARGSLPDELSLHRCLLAYCSDFSFVTTAMRPHGVTWVSRRMQVASIDHVMWFHRDFRMDDWLLHVMESPSASGARGFARGRIFSRDGTLVASTAQEGLMRRRPDR